MRNVDSIKVVFISGDLMAIGIGLVVGCCAHIGTESKSVKRSGVFDKWLTSGP